jgi:hypothetical protein
MTKKRIKSLSTQNQFGYGQYSDIIYSKDDLGGIAKRARAEANRLIEYAGQCDYLINQVKGIEFVGKTPVRRSGNMVSRKILCVWDGRYTIREQLPGNNNKTFKVTSYLSGGEATILCENVSMKLANEAAERFIKQARCPDHIDNGPIIRAGKKRLTPQGD